MPSALSEGVFLFINSNIYITVVILLLQMLQNYNKYRVLAVFFDNPTREFHIRYLGRRLKLAVTSVTNYLKELTKENFIIKSKEGLYPSYKANRDYDDFKFYKKVHNVIKIRESGLIKYLDEFCLPTNIILFGSFSKGKDIESSDIDIFVEAKEKKANLEKYEKRLNRKINLFFEENFNKLSKELRNNIINGIKLEGYLKVF